MAKRKGADDGKLDAAAIDMGRMCTDREAAAASLVEVPSLRVLQAVRAIAAAQVPKRHGGFRRMWSVRDVCRAAVAGGLHADLGWSFRLAGDVLRRAPHDFWPWLYQDRRGVPTAPVPGRDELAPERPYVGGRATDCRFEIVNGMFLYMWIPMATDIFFPGATEDTIPVGIVIDHGIRPVPWIPDDEKLQGSYRQSLGDQNFTLALRTKKQMQQLRQDARVLVQANLGVYYRSCLRRLLGLEVKSYEDLVQQHMKGTQP